MVRRAVVAVMGAEVPVAVPDADEECDHAEVDDDGYCPTCGEYADEDEDVSPRPDLTPAERWTQQYGWTGRKVPARYTTRVCPVCGNDYTPKRADQQTCDEKCKARKWRAMQAAKAGRPVKPILIAALQAARDRELVSLDRAAEAIDVKAAAERATAEAAMVRARKHATEAAEVRRKRTELAAQPLIAGMAPPTTPRHFFLNEAHEVKPSRWYCTKVCGGGPWDDGQEPDACVCGGNLVFTATPPLGPDKWRGGVRRHDGKITVQR